MKDFELISRIAYLYYVENMTQAQISKELNIYRTSISRYLQQARQYGVVKFEIENFNPELLKLEKSLKESFFLKEVRVIPTKRNGSIHENKSFYFIESSKFINKKIVSNSNIGLAWGESIGNMIYYLDSRKLTNVHVTPLVGGPGHIKTQFHVNTLTYELGKKINGQACFINASVIEENADTAKSIMQSKYFTDIKNNWKNLDIAIVSIGGGLNEKSQWRDLLTAADVEELKNREVVGDCCGRFYDRYGKIIKGNIDNRTIGLTLENLAHIPISITMLFEKKKVSSAWPILKKGIINTLIIDEDTAIELLKRNR